jgi:hypothetical protein
LLIKSKKLVAPAAPAEAKSKAAEEEERIRRLLFFAQNAERRIPLNLSQPLQLALLFIPCLSFAGVRAAVKTLSHIRMEFKLRWQTNNNYLLRTCARVPLWRSLAVVSKKRTQKSLWCRGAFHQAAETALFDAAILI